MNVHSTLAPIERVEEHNTEANRARETARFDELIVVLSLLAFMVFFFYFVFVP